jgi:hypothetical protein
LAILGLELKALHWQSKFSTCLSHTSSPVFFIRSSVVGHLGWFHRLAHVNSAAINKGMQVSPLCVYLHCRYMTKSGMTGS